MKPLNGYVGVELADWQGQLCGRFLADLGMDIVLVEPLGGHDSRSHPPTAPSVNAQEAECSIRFSALNAGKRSLAVDSTTEAGGTILTDLVAAADVVMFGLEFQDDLLFHEDLLKEFNSKKSGDDPGPIMARVSGFGPSGPYRRYRAPDPVVTAMGGLTAISGNPDEEPCRPPESQGYYFASLWCAQAIIATLWRKQRGGDTAMIDVPAYGAIATLDQMIRAWGYDGVKLERGGSQHPRVAPSRVFPTADGFVHLYVSRAHWDKFLAAWPDHPEELDDPKWVGNEARRRSADLINRWVSDFTSSRRTAELTASMQKAGIPCLPVNRPSDFMSDPHVQEREVFTEAPHPCFESFQPPGSPVVIDGKRSPAGRVPRVGEHTVSVLERYLHLDQADIRKLVAAGVVQCADGADGP